MTEQSKELFRKDIQTKLIERANTILVSINKHVKENPEKDPIKIIISDLAYEVAFAQTMIDELTQTNLKLVSQVNSILREINPDKASTG